MSTHSSIRSVLSIALVAGCLGLPKATGAQEISIEGVARSASSFSALVSQCQKFYFIDVAKAKKVERIYVNTGTKVLGKAKFGELLAKEMKRRLAEVRATGVAQWCAYQRSHIQQIGGGEVFEKPNQKSGAAADEMAMVVASVVIAQKRCGLQIADIPLGPVFAKRGLDLKAFLPDGAYASVVETKMKKAEEFIELMGAEKACEGINDTIRRFLPEIVMTGETI